MLRTLACPRFEPRAPARGFTLLELVVVMAVLAIIAVLALPGAADRLAQAQRNARDELRVLIEHARDSAHAQRRDTCVVFSGTLAAARYATAGGCNGAPLAWAAGGNAAVAAPAGVTFSGPAQLRFDARGRPTASTDQIVGVGALSLTVLRGSGRVQ